MFMEDKILVENVISKEHIDELYNLYIMLSEEGSYKIIPLHFINVFTSLSAKKNLQIDKEHWTQLFSQMDSDKDGRISFQDFVKFIYSNLRVIFGELGDKLSLSKINLLTTNQENQVFHFVVSQLFFRVGNNSNPFVLVEQSRQIQPVCVNFIYNLRKTGLFKNSFDADFKNSTLANTLRSLNDLSTITQILQGLNDLNAQIIFQTVVNFNKMLTPFNFVTSPYEVINSVPQILYGFNNLASQGIIDKLNFLYNLAVDTSNAYMIKRILKIFIKLINISTYILDLHSFSLLNEMPFTKGFDNELKGFKEYIENLILNKILIRINYLFEVDSLEITHYAYMLALTIAKKGIVFMNIIVTETNFLSCLFKKIDNLLNSQQRMFYVNYNILNPHVELKKCLFYCMQLTSLACTLKDNYTTYYAVLGSIVNKMVTVAESMREAFLASDSYFQYYYLILVGLLTKKTNFDDKAFIVKAQEAVNKNVGQLMKPYCFYVKNFLLSRMKKDSLLVIVEAKTIDFFDLVVESNRNEEYMISEFLDLLETIIEEHRATLVNSSLLRDIIWIFQKMLRYYNQNVAKKVLALLRSLTSMKEMIVDSLILECDIIPLISAAVLIFKSKNKYLIDLYQIVKVTFDTLLIGDVLLLLTHLVQSDFIKNNPKYFKSFNIQNLTHIVDLFNAIYSYYIPYTEDNPNSFEEYQLFERYKDLINNNIPNTIIELIGKCMITLQNIFNQYSNNKDVVQILQIDTLSSYLQTVAKDLKEKYQKLEDVEGTSEDLTEYNYEDLFLYVQSKHESDCHLWTTFKFNGDDLTFTCISATIKKHYKSDLVFYYYEESDGVYIRIKDESDFYDLLNNVVHESRALKRSLLYMKLFVDDSEKTLKFKLLSTCLNCGKKFEVEEKEQPSKELLQLCESCKNSYLSQIVNNISLNLSRNSPFKNFTPLSNIYNYK